MPESDELQALWDRLALRYVVPYIQDPTTWEQWLMALATPGGTVAAVPTLDRAALSALQDAAVTVDVRRIIPTLHHLKSRLAQDGITLSDRRWARLLHLVQAEAVLQGRMVAQADDTLVPTACWQTPDQIPIVTKALYEIAAPLDLEALQWQDEALEILRASQPGNGDAG
jgi:MoxR-like ATPase